METDQLYQRKFQSGLSTIWLYNDRIEISNTNTPQNTIVYFDEVIACGFLDMDINSTRGGSMYSFYNEYKDHELVITYRSGRETITGRQCKELKEISAFINEKVAAGNFPPRDVKPLRNNLSGNYGQVKFADDKKSYTLSIVAAIALFVMIIGMLLFSLSTLPIAIFLFIFFGIACFMAYSFRADYTEVQVYDDHISIRGFTGNVISDVYYSDIKSAGFLHGPIIYNKNIDGPAGSGNYARPEYLIIIPYRGSRIEISRSLSNLHQLAAIIEQNIQ